MKLGLLESRSRVPRRNLNSQCSLVELGVLGPEQRAGTAPAAQHGEARPSRFVKYSVTSESEPELAKSSDEESSDEAERGRARPSRKGTVEAATMVPCELGQQGIAQQLQQLWDEPQIRELQVKEVREHGSLGGCASLCVTAGKASLTVDGL